MFVSFMTSFSAYVDKSRFSQIRDEFRIFLGIEFTDVEGVPYPTNP